MMLYSPDDEPENPSPFHRRRKEPLPDRSKAFRDQLPIGLLDLPRGRLWIYPIKWNNNLSYNVPLMEMRKSSFP